MSKKKTLVLGLAFIVALGGGLYVWSRPPITPATPQTYNIKNAEDKIVGVYTVPSDADIAKEPNAEQILYGKRLNSETKRLLPDYVGAQMNCSSCHIAQARAENGIHYINVMNIYPTYKSRAGKEIDMATRINGCFQRSMNGKPLPIDSKEMKAMIAYMEWLRQSVPRGQLVDMPSVPKIDKSLVPNTENGRIVYAEHCSSCHGANGEGLKDARGDIIFPPLWGDESFNIGAGMARTFKAAPFVYANMPMSVQTKGLWGKGGVLTQQEAVDVAEYFTHMPRPDFPAKINDWPHGDKPSDARY